jgi:hypothetical protein
MPIEGYIDDTSPTGVRGWVYDRSDPDRALSVEIWDARERIAVITADVYREDLQRAGKGNGHHAFHFELPDGQPTEGELRARVSGRKWFLLRSASTPNQGVPPWHAYFQHTMEHGLPEAPYGFTPTPPATPGDTELAARLIRAWRAAQDKGSTTTPKREDMWTHNERSYHGTFADLIERDDAEGLAEYLRELFARPITHGIFQGEEATKGLAAGSAAATFVAAMFMDSLASLAEALGVLHEESPEQHGLYGENLFEDVEELVGKISSAVGFDIIPPVVAGQMFGIRTTGGIIHTRDFSAIWAGLRIREVLAGARTQSVCEIGGGVGNVAYYAWKLGVRRYTIIDLPNINLVQGWYLIRALPGAAIVLQGERDPGGDAIRILPTWRFEESVRYGLLFNQDSFPEMHPSISARYLDKARDAAEYLLSINQEAEAPQPGGRQTVVADLVREVGGYQRIYRFRHWLRRGYVEELYKITPQSLDAKLGDWLITRLKSVYTYLRRP